MRVDPRLLAMAPALVLAAAPRPAHALLCGTILDPLSVSATALAFGSYNASSPTPRDATGSVTVSCGLGLDLLPAFTVSISAGSGSFATRKMAFGASRLNYNIYTDGGRTTIWGDGTAGTVTQSYSTVLVLGSITYTAYGRVPVGQYVASGAYADTRVVPVTS